MQDVTSMRDTKRAPAGFWIRFVANFIDGLVLFFPMFFVSLTLVGGAAATMALMDGEGALLSVFGLQFGLFMAQLLYFVLMESSSMQGTLGKRIMGIRVQRADGSRISKGQAIGRYLGKILSGFLYIGYIMAGVRKDKRALHDLMASTYVNIR